MAGWPGQFKNLQDYNGFPFRRRAAIVVVSALDDNRLFQK